MWGDLVTLPEFKHLVWASREDLRGLARCSTNPRIKLEADERISDLSYFQLHTPIAGNQYANSENSRRFNARLLPWVARENTHLTVLT